MTVNFHYCGGELNSVSFDLQKSAGKCICGSKKMDKKCCKDKHLQLKVKDQHKLSDLKISFKSDVVKILPPVKPTIVVDLPFYFQENKAVVNNRPPPDVIPSPSLFLLNCVFRI